MKNTVVSIALSLVAFLNVQAQEFKGLVVYESKTDMSDFKNRMKSNREMTPEMQQAMEARIKKMSEKTFILNFNKEASIYKEEEKLDTPGQDSGSRTHSMLGGAGTFYKNVKEKKYIVDRDFMSKEFLVKDTLSKMDWKITGESRQIGGYNCFKATAVVAANKSDLMNYRFKKEPEKKPETAQGKAEPAKSTNFMDQFEIPKEITITAWFTPEISVSQGPEKYWGLPGLILEVSDGKTVVLCSKVVLNSKDKTEIKAPTKGTVVTQKEYDNIVAKKMEEMRQMNEGRGNAGFGRSPH